MSQSDVGRDGVVNVEEFQMLLSKATEMPPVPEGPATMGGTSLVLLRHEEDRYNTYLPRTTTRQGGVSHGCGLCSTREDAAHRHILSSFADTSGSVLYYGDDDDTTQRSSLFGSTIANGAAGVTPGSE